MTGNQDSSRSLMTRALAAREPGERAAIVRELQRGTTWPAFSAARSFGESRQLGERILGLEVLGQLGYPAGRPFLAETLPVVLAACDDERPQVLSAAIIALGHLADSRGLAAVLGHLTHGSEEVRFAVAVALPSVAGEPPAPAAVAGLIRLTSDSDPEVRDWATMGLAGLEADSAEIRDALLARLADQGGDTAGEALVGLARRKDRRIHRVLLSLLEDDPGNLIVEAAAELGAPEALPALLRLKEQGWQETDPRPSVLHDAIRACARPAGEA